MRQRLPLVAPAHQIALPIRRQAGRRTIGDQQAIGIEEERRRGAGEPPAGELADRLAVVAPALKQQAPAVETDGHPLPTVMGQAGDRRGQGKAAGDGELEGGRLSHAQRQKLRPAAAEKPAGRGQEIVHLRQRQQEGGGIQQGIGLQRTVHHRHGAAGLIEAAEIGIGPLQRGDHAEGPQ